MRFSKTQLRDYVSAAVINEARRHTRLTRFWFVLWFTLGALAGGGATYAAIRVFNLI